MRVVIVGASSKIGLELATLLQGHEVIQWSRASGVDVCNWEAELPAVEETIDGLVYLPGTIDLKPIGSLKLEDFRQDWEINLLGAVRVVQHLLPQMGEGSGIVLVSSVAAKLGLSFHASIGSAKAAVEGFGRALAAELAPKVRVNIVAPSLTETPMAEKLLDTDAKREASSKRHPLQRVGHPKDIAAAIAFFLEAGWVTGQVLGVDGGLSHLRPI